MDPDWDWHLGVGDVEGPVQVECGLDTYAGYGSNSHFVFAGSAVVRQTRRLSSYRDACLVACAEGRSGPYSDQWSGT